MQNAHKLALGIVPAMSWSFMSNLYWCDSLLVRCSKGVDLNRDFPDVLAFSDGPLVASGGEQAETAAVMRWSGSTPFVGSASMHEVLHLILHHNYNPVVVLIPFHPSEIQVWSSNPFITAKPYCSPRTRMLRPNA